MLAYPGRIYFCAVRSQSCVIALCNDCCCCCCYKPADVLPTPVSSPLVLLRPVGIPAVLAPPFQAVVVALRLRYRKMLSVKKSQLEKSTALDIIELQQKEIDLFCKIRTMANLRKRAFHRSVIRR